MEGLTGLANKRLVIFGCGYVGAEIARQARRVGMTVTALTRNPEKAAALAALGVETVIDNLAADTWHGRVAAGVELVLNCVSSGGGGIAGYRRSYVEGMRSVLVWAQHHTIATIIYTSSTSVYPQGAGAIIDETAPTEGVGESGRILVEAETLLCDSPGAGQRRCILRLAGIYGPGRHHLLDQLRTGAAELAGSGEPRLNLAHRDDICAAIWAVFGAPDSINDRIYNVADDAPARKAEVVQWLAERLGRASPRFTGGAASERRGFAAPPDRIISNTRLKAELGWRPRFPSYREGYTAILAGLGQRAESSE